MKKNRLIEILIGLTAILIYFSFSYVQLFILDILNIDYDNMTLTFKVIYLITTELIEMALIISLFYKKIKEDIKDLIKNHEKYFKTYFKYWLFILAIMAISNIIIMLITKNQTSGNEESFRELVVTSPIYAYFSGVIFAPIIEELIFRRGIRNILKNNNIFILISGLIFGSLHIITGYSGPIDLLYLIPYCTPGLIFAYIITKTDNVLVPASIHFMHNGILVAIQMFAYLFLS